MGTPTCYPVGPDPQGLIAITTLVFSSGTMQSHIGKIRGNFDRGLKPSQVERAVGGIMALQFAVNGVAFPRRIAKLKCVAVICRKRSQETAEPFQVQIPIGRQLEQNRT